MDRVKCKKCSNMILPTTVEATGGICMPCFKKDNPKSLYSLPKELEGVLVCDYEGYKNPTLQSVSKFVPDDFEKPVQFLEKFIQQLSSDEFEFAFQSILSSAYSPAELKRVLQEFSINGELLVITPPSEATGLHPNIQAKLGQRTDDGEFITLMHERYPFYFCWSNTQGVWVPLYAHADLPINGAWTDITLQFDFSEHNGEFLPLIEDIEVM